MCLGWSKERVGSRDRTPTTVLFSFIIPVFKNPYLPDNKMKMILCNITQNLLLILTFCRSPVKWANSTISFPNWLNICTNSWKLLTFSSCSIVARTCKIGENTVDYQDAKKNIIIEIGVLLFTDTSKLCSLKIYIFCYYLSINNSTAGKQV